MRLLRALRYWFRHGLWIRCAVPTCYQPSVGLSIWCREHTDQILEHRHSPELRDELNRRSHR